METVIVEIIVPATNRIYDFALPAKGRVQESIESIIDTLEYTENNITFDRECPMLCDVERKTVMQAGMTILEAGIHDGSRLMLL